VSADALVTEVLMESGGPTRRSALKQMRISRGGQVIWGGAPLQEALIEGRTLDQLSMQAGDEIYVPTMTSRLDILRTTLGIGIPLIALLTRIF
jgi:hypothetical protein